MKKYFLVFIIFIVSGITLFGQDVSIDSLYRTEEYKFPILPKFTVLFDTIMSRSPQRMKLQEAKLDAFYNLGLIKRDWMNYISMSGSFSYGKGGSLGVAKAPDGSMTTSLTNSATSTYGGGVGVGFSLGAILNYKTKVRMAKIKVNQAQYELDISLQELRIKLFEQYTQLERDMEAFKATSGLMEMNNAQIVLSEKEFRIGRSNLQQLISARQSYVSAVTAYEAIKRSCKIGIFYFEQLSGMDFRQYQNPSTEPSVNPTTETNTDK